MPEILLDRSQSVKNSPLILPQNTENFYGMLARQIAAKSAQGFDTRAVLQESLAGKRMLLVLAHPDDDTCLSEVTRRFKTDLGMRTTAVLASKGEGGELGNDPRVEPSWRLGGIRLQEFERAMNYQGVEGYYYLGLPDGGMKADDWDSTIKLIGIIRETKPALIGTTSGFEEIRNGKIREEHRDHKAMFNLTRAARELAALPIFSELGVPHYTPVIVEPEMMIIAPNRYDAVLPISEPHKPWEHWSNYLSQFSPRYQRFFWEKWMFNGARVKDLDTLFAEAHKITNGSETLVFKSKRKLHLVASRSVTSHPTELQYTQTSKAA